MTVARNGDVGIAYELRGEGLPLLLIHGLGYARWGWGPVGGPLADRFELALFDNRGIGESDVPAGPYTISDMAADAAAVLDAAGIDPANVLGTSLGGMVALQLALDRPELIDRLVLACTTPGGPKAFPYPEPTLRLLDDAPNMEPLVALRRFVENALAPGASDALVEEILALRVANPPDPTGWAGQAAAAGTFDAFERLGEIDAPTLVLHGTEDQVVDVRNAGLLAERIPDARAEQFEGAGHLFFWEQPEQFVTRVAEFLA